MTTYLDPWVVYDALEYDPHPAQEEVLSCPARNRLVAAGRRFGKSDLGGHELVPEGLLTRALANMLRLEGKRRDELLRAGRHDDLHVGAAILESTRQFGTLIGGDAARDAEYDAHV